MGGRLTDQEEIVETTRLIADQVHIDDSTARWIPDGNSAAIVLWCILDVLLKESLVDPLVNNDQCNLWLCKSTRELFFDYVVKN